MSKTNEYSQAPLRKHPTIARNSPFCRALIGQIQMTVIDALYGRAWALTFEFHRASADDVIRD